MLPGPGVSLWSIILDVKWLSYQGFSIGNVSNQPYSVPAMAAIGVAVATELGDSTASSWYIALWTMTCTIAFMVRKLMPLDIVLSTTLLNGRHRSVGQTVTCSVEDGLSVWFTC
jgi:hypothetical protein